MGRNSAVNIAFGNYTKFITNEFLEKYGPSYANQDNTRNAWRQNVAYSKEAVLFLIQKSITFVATLPGGDPKSTDPHFLNALTTRMADYLSAYTMRANELQKSKNIKPQSRKSAKQELKLALYDNSSYIQNLFRKQKEKREKRTRNPHYREELKREDALQAANKNYAVMKEVQIIFAKANSYKIKR